MTMTPNTTSNIISAGIRNSSSSAMLNVSAGMAGNNSNSRKAT